MLQRAGGRRHDEESTVEPRPLRFPDRTWVVYLLICTVAAAVAFEYIDVPVARHFYGMFGTVKSLGTGLGSFVLVGVETAIALGLVIVRLRRGRLSPFGETTALACLTSICAYAVNDSILKHVFGVPNPWFVLQGSSHAFNFLGGSSMSSFPSGHMVLAGSFAGVFMRLYRRSVLLLSALLGMAVLLLIMGDWHFVSDVIAGTFLGVSTGLLAGEVWLVHSK